MSESPVLSQILEEVRPADAGAMRRAVARQMTLTKPPGSLGRLEDVSVRLAGIFGVERPVVREKAVIVAAGDHGVVAQGVTGYPQAVTAQMVRNFLAGGAAISVMACLGGVDQIVVDAGIASVRLPDQPGLRNLRIGRGTADMSRGPAMSREQALRCLETGAALAAEVAASDVDLIATGDMGIGNTTASSAIAAVMTGRPPAETTGEGTGRSPEELCHKTAVVRMALQANAPDPSDPVDVLAKVGGFEIGVLAGVVLGAASERRAVVLDGFISGAAALIAHGLSPAVRDYLIASHRSAEKGHRAVLAHLGLDPLLDLGMRLGEGTGAVLAMGIIETAAACLTGMATFGEAGVSDRPEVDGMVEETGG
ncbi:MAG: nicotinate-nucleotide--dimethylbenzimidazole phosphoribosyltransferase [bacterium]|nr:nicotinate-nucleotide--dimethylbenzimidazole phosphoribosyltransferase [bacterium]MDE0289509.1 nicotinate-nucleotide--dimethylbenzimidazole phosphoribosyltransferase [bacterium]MDE0438485.1 nicotinate-nucleotide--dimethylbenzimidazole phosphoribosyltransferase [bacterium]